MSLILKKMQKEDVKELQKRLNDLSDEDKKLYHPHPFTVEYLNSLLNVSYDHYFVLEKNGIIVGYSMLRTFGKYPIPTYGQVIWQEYRGKGYGSLILVETIKQAKKLGYESVKLKVYEHNKIAFNLYIKHGFTKLGVEGNDIWMELKLS